MAEVLNLLPSNHWPSQWRRLAHLDEPRSLCAVQSDCLPVRVISDADAIAGNGIITFCNQSCVAGVRCRRRRKRSGGQELQTQHRTERE